jgi:uncharacterized glyoxalase superfamily protein PhnB
VNGDAEVIQAMQRDTRALWQYRGATHTALEYLHNALGATQDERVKKYIRAAMFELSKAEPEVKEVHP